MNSENGINVTKAFKIAKEIGEEIDSLYKGIDDLIEEVLVPTLSKESKIRPNNGIKKGKASEESSGWVSFEYLVHYNLYQPSAKKNFSGAIAFHTILIPDHRFPNMEEPIFTVLFSDTEWEINNCKWNWGEEDESSCELGANGKIMTWDNEGADWAKGEWAFSLPLVSLTSLEDVKNHVVIPIGNILSGQADTAFPDDSPAISFNIADDEHGFVPVEASK